MNRPPAGLLELVRSGEARRLRKAAGIRLQTMADALRVSQGDLSLYERGRCLPRLPRAAAWLRVLQGLAWHEQAIQAGDDP